MNGFRPPVSEEDLHGFVDGETAPERREAILAYLSASPADAARVDSWRRQKEAIRAAFAHVETEHVPLSWSLARAPKRSRFPCKLLSGQDAPASIKEQAGPRSSFWRRRGHAALLVASFASGAMAAIGAPLLIERINAPNPAPFAGVSLAPSAGETDAGFIDRTTSALLAFAPPPPATGTATLAKGDKTAPVQGQTGLILPNLAGAGLKLAGVRVAPGEFEQMFCLFHTSAANLPVALCVEKAEGAAASRFRKTGHFPSGAITWRQRGAKYALAGALTEIELRNLAERAHAEVEAFVR